MTASNSSGVALAITGTPTVSATQSLVRIGNAIAGGNVTAGTGGTYLGINQPSSGAGSTADFFNFQNNGVMKAQLSTTGGLTLADSSLVSRNANSGSFAAVSNTNSGNAASSSLILGSDGGSVVVCYLVHQAMLHLVERTRLTLLMELVGAPFTSLPAAAVAYQSALLEQ